MQRGDAIGRYRLERLLGEGGMKQVWRARRADGTEVALAVVHRFDPQRFVHELNLAGRVHSPHVAQVLDGFVTDDGLGVVVTELCAGLDLARYRLARKLTPGEAVALTAQMATGLVAIHAAEVLHRDVKPANAILTPGGVKLIDFGVSVPAIDEHTSTGSPVRPAGTLPYMAPETLHGVVDARIDTYALGVSLFHLIVGRPPELSGQRWVQLLEDGEAMPLDDLRGVPVVVTAMVARLCAPQRERRPFVADVALDLQALTRSLHGELPPFIALAASTPTEPEPAVAAGPTTLVDAAPAPALAAHGPIPRTSWQFAIAVPDPGRIVVGWPHLPLLALVPAGGGTIIRGFGHDGPVRTLARVEDQLTGGLVGDLDGDGVGELYVWSARRLHAVDAAGRLRWSLAVELRAGDHAWDDGALAPLVLGDERSRILVAGDREIDPATGSSRPVAAAWQGRGDALVDAGGVTGLSAHGAARQRFRGDVGTAAAILTHRGVPGFVVAALERVFDGRPTVRLGLWGPGGQPVGAGVVGRYDYQTAPFEDFVEAQQPATRLFDARVAPLAALGDDGPDDVIIVPFLHNAPWFGPLLVAFDRTGAERWRERLPVLTATPPAPPMLVDLDGDGRPQLLWADGEGRVLRRDAATGAPRPPLSGAGVPVAALDLCGRGEVHLVGWTPDAIMVTRHGPCLPGVVHWLPTRGDLWRSGTLGPDHLPVGPRA